MRFSRVLSADSPSFSSPCSCASALDKQVHKTLALTTQSNKSDSKHQAQAKINLISILKEKQNHLRASRAWYYVRHHQNTTNTLQPPYFQTAIPIRTEVTLSIKHKTVKRKVRFNSKKYADNQFYKCKSGNHEHVLETSTGTQKFSMTKFWLKWQRVKKPIIFII